MPEHTKHEAAVMIQVHEQAMLEVLKKVKGIPAVSLEALVGFF